MKVVGVSRRLQLFEEFGAICRHEGFGNLTEKGRSFTNMVNTNGPEYIAFKSTGLNRDKVEIVFNN